LTFLELVAQKGVTVVITVLFVTFLSFILMRLSPIDPATAYVKRHTPIVTEEQIEEARTLLGLDKPLVIQYGCWLAKAVQLDLGRSLSSGRNVSTEIKNYLENTVRTMSISALIMSLGILFFGILSYLAREGIWNGWFRFWSIIFVSVPSFYLAIVFLDFFSTNLGIIKVSGNSGFWKYFPAALCLAIPAIAFYSTMLFSSLEREMKKDYIFYGRSRGVSEIRLLFFHALPQGIIDLVPSFAQMIGLVLAASVVVERVFALSGIGDLIVKSVIERDSPVIHGAVLVLALILVLLDFAAAVIQLLLNKNRRRG